MTFLISTLFVATITFIAAFILAPTFFGCCGYSAFTPLSRRVLPRVYPLR